MDYLTSLTPQFSIYTLPAIARNVQVSAYASKQSTHSNSCPTFIFSALKSSISPVLCTLPVQQASSLLEQSAGKTYPVVAMRAKTDACSTPACIMFSESRVTSYELP